MNLRIVLVLCILALVSCQEITKQDSAPLVKDVVLDIAQANKLAQLPLDCIQTPLPYKSGIVISRPEDLAMPIEHHPTFYGCFDWHSAVHGHWSLVYLMKRFSDVEWADRAKKMISQNITPENIAIEIQYFSLNRYTKSFERTYGWAWLLKLQEELYTWDDLWAKETFRTLAPLAEVISKKYQEYLPKLVYPIRVGEHTNTAFGISFAYDYAKVIGDNPLEKSIRERAISFYKNDQNCPLSWEPSGYDFLSPCWQEVDIMRKVLSGEEFNAWFADFLTADEIKTMEPAIVLDRNDGKLVHLDGLNFSRAWCLYPLSKKDSSLRNLANQHLQFSLDKMFDGDYAGGHWLASFALYAFKMQEEYE